jgi:glycosyltransferase involved in cell wall biosynthesis
MKNPFLSIIIPLYNKEQFVNATIQSVLNQTFQDFEILVVNDCSTDKSLAVVESLNSSKIRIINHIVNKGLSASRNTGIKNSVSDYMVFLDADDLMKPGFLEKIASLIQTFSAAKIFATCYEEVYEHNKIVTPKLNLIAKDDGLIPNFFEVNLQQSIYCMSSFCVKKSAFEVIGFFDEKITYSEDIDFNIRANQQLKLAYSPEVLIQYIMTYGSQITKNSLKNKTIPNFEDYEKWTKTNSFLKKYLDLNRYMLANTAKKQGDWQKFYTLKNGIHKNPEISGLNFKQRFLLKLPRFVLICIDLLKLSLLKIGIKVSSFG